MPEPRLHLDADTSIRSLAELIAALGRLLTTTDAADWPGQVRWLDEWRTWDD
jgi:hypothetical protein